MFMQCVYVDKDISIRGGSRILEKGGLFMNNNSLKRGRVRDGDPAHPARGPEAEPNAF